MKVLPKNHPRFCSKYVRFVGFAEVPRRTKLRLSIDGQTFERVGSSDLRVGDSAFLAKEIPTLRGKARLWAVHEIILAEAYWNYEAYEKDVALNRKHRRKNPYQPYASTWFGKRSYLVGLI